MQITKAIPFVCVAALSLGIGFIAGKSQTKEPPPTIANQPTIAQNVASINAQPLTGREHLIQSMAEAKSAFTGEHATEILGVIDWFYGQFKDKSEAVDSFIRGLNLTGKESTPVLAARVHKGLEVAYARMEQSAANGTFPVQGLMLMKDKLEHGTSSVDMERMISESSGKP